MAFPPGPTRPSIQCPRCQRWSVGTPVCAWCHQPFYLPPPPRQPTGPRIGVDRRFNSVGAGAQLVAALLGAIISLIVLTALDTPLQLRQPGAALGALLAALAVRLTLRRTLARRLAAQARSYMQRTEVRAIRDVLDGYVRLVGTARALKPIADASGDGCLAFERRTLLPDGSLEIHAEGGAFELDDGSGAIAVVRAARVGVAEGVQVGNQVVIPPNARIELTGRARWVMAEDSEWRGSLRSAARVLEIVGDETDPVVIRMLDVPAAKAPESSAPPGASEAPAPTGVRVAVDGASTPAGPPESLDAELERMAQEELRRDRR